MISCSAERQPQAATAEDSSFQRRRTRWLAAAVAAVFPETFHLNFKHNLTSVFLPLCPSGQAVSHLSTSLQRGT